jgi:xylan 1,4-beta-xylosidase
VDREHSNAYEVWKQMESPQKPTAEQYARLERASELQLLKSPEWVYPSNRELSVNFTLPRQGVSLLKLIW